MKNICLIVSSELTVKAFLISHLKALREEYRVTVVANTDNPVFLHPYGLDTIEVVPVAIPREISPFKDLVAFFALFRFFQSREFVLIHSVTPKAGLLAMLAGFVARIPVRFHTFTGQVWATRTGFMRFLLKNMDRLLAAAATDVMADSSSQRDFLVANRVVLPRKISVLANGSISGVDLDRFQPRPEKRAEIRHDLKIPENSVLFLYVGRLNRDKGILDLALAFARVAGRFDSVRLMFVGPDEGGLRGEVMAICKAVAAQVTFVGYTKTPEEYMAAADVFCLPSYREGFGSVVIEAAAVGIPAIASRIYGIVDAVVEKETGLLFAPGEVDQIVAAMEWMIGNQDKRKAMGQAARIRAARDFSRQLATDALLGRYHDILGEKITGAETAV